MQMPGCVIEEKEKKHRIIIFFSTPDCVSPQTPFQPILCPSITRSRVGNQTVQLPRGPIPIPLNPTPRTNKKHAPSRFFQTGLFSPQKPMVAAPFWSILYMQRKLRRDDSKECGEALPDPHSPPIPTLPSPPFPAFPFV